MSKLQTWLRYKQAILQLREHMCAIIVVINSTRGDDGHTTTNSLTKCFPTSLLIGLITHATWATRENGKPFPDKD